MFNEENGVVSRLYFYGANDKGEYKKLTANLQDRRGTRRREEEFLLYNRKSYKYMFYIFD